MTDNELIEDYLEARYEVLITLLCYTENEPEYEKLREKYEEML